MDEVYGKSFFSKIDKSIGVIWQQRERVQNAIRKSINYSSLIPEHGNVRTVVIRVL
jgi:hypothetical protein